MPPNPSATHIDYAILGLLKQSPLSGYRIRLVFERTALGTFSSSPGTIYPALNRMVSLRFIRKRPVAGKSQEVYEMTPKGRSALTQWILAPVTKDDVAKHMQILVLRCAFMDASADKRQLQFLKNFQQVTKDYIKELEQYYINEVGTLPLAGRLAFEHGIASYQTNLQWINKVILAYKSIKVKR